MRRLRSAAGPREVYTRLEHPERRSTEVIIQELRRPETARMELRPERRRDLRRAEIQERLQLLLRRIRPEIRQEPEWRLEITRPAGPGYSSGSTGSTSGSSASPNAPGGSTGTSTVSPGGNSGTCSNNNYYTNTGSVTGPEAPARTTTTAPAHPAPAHREVPVLRPPEICPSIRRADRSRAEFELFGIFPFTKNTAPAGNHTFLPERCFYVLIFTILCYSDHTSKIISP